MFPWVGGLGMGKKKNYLKGRYFLFAEKPNLFFKKKTRLLLDNTKVVDKGETIILW